MGRGALEPAVGFPVVPDAVDDVGAIRIGIHHVADFVGIILEVGIDGDNHIGGFHGFTHAGDQRRLVAEVAGKTQSAHARIHGVQFFDDVPGVIHGTIIDDQDVGTLTEDGLRGDLVFNGQ
ncbi:hypothetical protein AWRIB429_2104 [Oenococcus oeni AWRIB429]|uniref:Uncharacterized protein n=1 Tax=Oenococcus oeni AWRIB429 TaxID=655225 RepID=D3LCM5_OENOE|nr:hypothetical protein AWRIB429_2104 [Oenococcus oeni AWRIB429]